jgi:hypothetical protein
MSTYRATVFGSTPVSSAAAWAQWVRSNASRISMMCLPDLVIGPPVSVIDGVRDAIEDTPLEGRVGGCADFCCPSAWSFLSAYMEYEQSVVTLLARGAPSL